jgi:hypothetical protein
LPSNIGIVVVVEIRINFKDGLHVGRVGVVLDSGDIDNQLIVNHSVEAVVASSGDEEIAMQILNVGSRTIDLSAAQLSVDALLL